MSFFILIFCNSVSDMDRTFFEKQVKLSPLVQSELFFIQFQNVVSYKGDEKRFFKVSLSSFVSPKQREKSETFSMKE